MTGEPARRRVVFVHRVTCDYSKEFLVQLHQRLHAAGIDFVVASGAPWDGEGLVDVLDELPFGIRCPNRRVLGPLYRAAGARRVTRGADLVIAEQLNASLHLYPLIARRWLRRALHGAGNRRGLLAFYGHGATLSSPGARPWVDRWKRFFARQVDWWFAYTRISADIVGAAGVPRERITVFQNTVDTTSLRARRAALTGAELEGLRASLFGDGPAGPTGVFCGRLVALKWIPFLLESIARIHQALPDFRMVIVGDGPDAAHVRSFCERNPWCAWVGRQQGDARVPYLALGDLWLNPGMTGLAIVDAFALGLPWLTTDNGIHSPEIAYLREGRNGLMTRPRVEDFSAQAIRLLQDPARLGPLQAEARSDGGQYTVERMVDRMAEGIRTCLGAG